MNHLAADKPRKILVGNWKMNGTRAEASREIARLMQNAEGLRGQVQLIICPPVTTLSDVAAMVDCDLVWAGAQDCLAEPCGPRTGDVNAELISDAGAKVVILGHSERRLFHNEDPGTIRQKVQATWSAGMVAVLCVGETHEQRVQGKAIQIVCSQIEGSLPGDGNGDNTILAYEPVWAIGSGIVPTTSEIETMVLAIRAYLKGRGRNFDNVKILYGGSVNKQTAHSILAEAAVDGLLVGKASLRSDEFLEIARACLES